MTESEKLSKLIVLIVEDDKDTLDILQSLLEEDVQKIYTASDGLEGFELYKTYKPDIIISDINMPLCNGLEMLHNIRKTDINTPLIFLSAHSEIEYLQKAIDLKASSYIIKPIEYYELIEKILLNITTAPANTQLELLSKREYEIFFDLAKGIKPAQIALKYDIKPKTVSTYRNRILDKLGFNNNSDIVKFASTNQLI